MPKASTGRRLRAVELEQRRWMYRESPLVASCSPTTRTTGRRTVQTNHSVEAVVEGKTIRHVTPSPQSEITTNSPSNTHPFSSVGGKRQLFQSVKQSTTALRDAKKILQRRSVSSPIQRCLFRSTCHKKKSPNHHQKSFRSNTIDDVRNRPCPLNHKAADFKSSTTTKPTKRNRIKTCQSNEYGITSWDSLVSVASVPSSPNKSKVSNRKHMTPADKSVEQLVAFNDPKDLSSSRSIPHDLVSLLLPAGLKSTTRLPQTHQDVLKKAESQRKKQVPMRTKLPRRCKTTPSVYTEDSDDDLFFDTLWHQQGTAGIIPSISGEDTTARPVPRAIPTTTPVVQSVPTSTNRSNNKNNQTSESEFNTQQSSKEIARIQRKRGRPPKLRLQMPVDTETQIEETSKPVMDSTPIPQTIEETPDVVHRRKRERSCKTLPMEDAYETRGRTRKRNQLHRQSRKQPLTPTHPHCIEMEQDTMQGKRYTTAASIVNLDPVNQKVEKGIPSTNQDHSSQKVQAPEKQRGLQHDKGQVVTQPVPPIETLTTTTTTKSTKPFSKSKIRKHKVRFAPTTTTFSLKIRVKTSAKTSKKGKKKVTHPRLSESTFQSIANQITQAYLAQSPNGLTQPRDDQTKVQSSDDEDDEEEEEDNGVVEDYDSDTSTSDEIDPDVEENYKNKTKAVATETPVMPMDEDEDEGAVVVGNLDSRSVASEITMDIDLLRGENERGALQSTFKEKVNKSLQDCEASVEDHFPSPSYNEESDDDQDHPQSQVQLHENCVARSRMEPVGISAFDVEPSRDRNTNSSHLEMLDQCVTQLQPGTKSRASEIQKRRTSSPQHKHKRRRFTSTDSLAGISLASISPMKSAGQEVPLEVSVNRRQILPESTRKATNVVEKSHVRDRPNGGMANGIDETVVTDKSADSQKWHRADGRCGKCCGCKEIFDCLACSKCIASLQEGKFRYGQDTGCLKRRCKGLSYKRSMMDTLCKAASSSTFEVWNNPATLEVDDASMSFFSETGSVYSNASKMRRSRAARLWSRRWSKERKEMLSTASVMSASKTETSKDVASNNNNNNNSKGRGRSRNKKSKSPLHDLQLPIPTDGSLASVLERRRSLRCLMHYDEADQDWL